MIRGTFLAILAGITAAEAAPPVVAPRPRGGLQVPGCDSCRFLIRPVSAGPIVPVQGGPSFEAISPPQPLPLPPQEDAAPLPNPGPPANPEPPTTLEGLLDRYLPEADPEERSAWADELRQLPPELARDILAARSRADIPQLTPEPPDTEPAPPASEPSPLRSARGPAPGDGRSDPVGDATLGALAQAEAVHRHNIANADTVGFKRSRPDFAEAADFRGLAVATARRVDSQGELEPTGGTFDLAIEGPGFFQLRRGDTVALTRRGMFRLNAAGEIVAEFAGEEWSLHPPVRIPPEAADVVVHESGAVGCRIAGEDEPTPVGQIELARVLDPSAVEAAGGGLLSVPPAAGTVSVGPPASAGFGAVRQGRLEKSNVRLDEEVEALSRLRRQAAALTGGAAPSLAAPARPEPLRAAETSPQAAF